MVIQELITHVDQHEQNNLVSAFSAWKVHVLSTVWKMPRNNSSYTCNFHRCHFWKKFSWCWYVNEYKWKLFYISSSVVREIPVGWKYYQLIMLNKTVHLIGIIYVQTAVSTGRYITLIRVNLSWILCGIKTDNFSLYIRCIK